MLDLHIDTKELVDWANALEQFPGRRGKEVISRTLNYVGDRARTVIFRTLAAKTGLTYGDVSDLLRVYRARPENLAYEVVAKGGHTTLARFGPRQVRAGVRARPWGQSRLYRGAFIVRKLPPLVFHRYGPSVIWGDERWPRQKIKPLYGPSLPKEMLREGGAAARQVIEDRLPDQFVKEMLRELRRKGGAFA